MIGLKLSFVGLIFGGTLAVAMQNTIPRCPNLMSPAGGRLVGECLEPRVGDECYMECDPGFRVTGVTRVRCISDGSNGRWENQLGRCERLTCSMLQAPLNGQLSGQCSQAQVNGVCMVTCSTGYRLQGAQSLTCMESGQWSTSMPMCIRQMNQINMNSNRRPGSNMNGMCPDINAPINGMVSGKCASARQGEICKFTCSTGFRLQGIPSLVCNPDGSWSGATPSCY